MTEMLTGFALVTLATTVVPSWSWSEAVVAVATGGGLFLVTGMAVILRTTGVWVRAPIGTLNAVTFLLAAGVSGIFTGYLLMVFGLTGSLSAAESGGDPGSPPWGVLLIATGTCLVALGALALSILFSQMNDPPEPVGAGMSELK